MSARALAAERQAAVDAAVDALDALALRKLRAIIRRAWKAALNPSHVVAAITDDSALDTIRAQWADVGSEVVAGVGKVLRTSYEDWSSWASSSFGGAKYTPMPDVVLDEYIGRHLAEASNRIRSIGEAAWQTASKSLIEGVRTGEANAELAGRLTDVLDMSEARATTIVRTEVISANNAGAMATGRDLAESGVFAMKEWVATGDGRTRPSHRDADGQRVPMDATFSVGGAELDYPGDPNGPAEEVINCRCTVVFDDAAPVVDLTAESDTTADQG